MSTLPSWDDQMRGARGVVDNLLATWRPDGATEAEMQDMNKLALSILASGYLCHVYTDARRPVFMPLWNYAFNQGGPDPDYVYSTAEIDPQACTGSPATAGTSRFVEITQQAFDMMSRRMHGRERRRDAYQRPRRPRPSATTALQRDPQRRTSGGPRRRLVGAATPETVRLLMRKCSCDWNNEVDAQVAIDRLDDDGADMTPEEIARRFSDLPDVDRGDDRVRHAADPLLPRAPRREHVPAVAARSTRWAGCPNRRTTTVSTRLTTTRR